MGGIPLPPGCQSAGPPTHPKLQSPTANTLPEPQTLPTLSVTCNFLLTMIQPPPPGPGEGEDLQLLMFTMIQPPPGSLGRKDLQLLMFTMIQPPPPGSLEARQEAAPSRYDKERVMRKKMCLVDFIRSYQTARRCVGGLSAGEPSTGQRALAAARFMYGGIPR